MQSLLASVGGGAEARGSRALLWGEGGGCSLSWPLWVAERRRGVRGRAAPLRRPPCCWTPGRGRGGRARPSSSPRALRRGPLFPAILDDRAKVQPRQSRPRAPGPQEGARARLAALPSVGPSAPLLPGQRDATERGVRSWPPRPSSARPYTPGRGAGVASASARLPLRAALGGAVRSPLPFATGRDGAGGAVVAATALLRAPLDPRKGRGCGERVSAPLPPHRPRWGHPLPASLRDGTRRSGGCGRGRHGPPPRCSARPWTPGRGAGVASAPARLSLRAALGGAVRSLLPWATGRDGVEGGVAAVVAATALLRGAPGGISAPCRPGRRGGPLCLRGTCGRRRGGEGRGGRRQGALAHAAHQSPSVGGCGGGGPGRAPPLAGRPRRGEPPRSALGGRISGGGRGASPPAVPDGAAPSPRADRGHSRSGDPGPSSRRPRRPDGLRPRVGRLAVPSPRPEGPRGRRRVPARPRAACDIAGTPGEVPGVTGAAPAGSVAVGRATAAAFPRPGVPRGPSRGRGMLRRRSR